MRPVIARRLRVRRILAVTGVVVACAPWSSAAAQQAPPDTTVTPGSGITQELTNDVVGAVGQVELALWSGTGWLASPQVVITNFHVSRAGNGWVKFTPSGGAPVRCWVAAADRAADLAALRCPASGRTPLRIASRDPVLGEPVVVVGYPGGVGPTVTTGRVTELSREVRRTDSLGFDAPIAPGSSGSPVVSARGEVLAVATFGGGYGSKAPKLREVIAQGEKASDTQAGALLRLFVTRSLIGGGLLATVGAYTGWRSGRRRGTARFIGGLVAGAAVAAAATGLQFLIDGPTNMIT